MEKEKIDWLINKNNCKQIGNQIYTQDNEYVTSLNDYFISDLLYEHKIINLSSLEKVCPELKFKNSKDVCIGFSKEENKWYGFTEKGYSAFEIGFKPNSWHWSRTYGYADENFECETLEDCKQMAICFCHFLKRNEILLK